MESGRIFIWVEGISDARFFSAVLKPFFEKHYSQVEIRTYANLKREKFSRILQALRGIRAEYLVIADIDSEPCVTSKKNCLRQRISDANPEKIRVVVMEIESWYLAGLDEAGFAELGITPFERTDTVTKEDFLSIMPREYESRIDFMMEILKRFSVKSAVRKNNSFSYFFSKQGFSAAGE
ncbi:MAG: hypothetical protein PHG91_01350 [Syntrophales bacterium]|nr:hypothetical protein [Syntrophales bacterium]MDD5532968.1 hypothetical protein [Syntrophales bacterium]HPL64819.1 hypothetical protein [Syntrophales bacterium]